MSIKLVENEYWDRGTSKDSFNRGTNQSSLYQKSPGSHYTYLQNKNTKGHVSNITKITKK